MWKCLSRPATGGLSAAHAFVPFTTDRGERKGVATKPRWAARFGFSVLRDDAAARVEG